MTTKFLRTTHLGWLAALLLSTLVATDTASAQNSSLVGKGAQRRPLTMAEQSWTHRPAQEPKPIQKHDLVTVLVDYRTQVASEGEVDRKKKADATMILKDWILLKGLAAIPDPQSLGDPTISGSMSNKYRAEGSVESRDTMKLSIACRVADIRPNGNLILEGHRTMINNLEQWDVSLSGEARPEDISANNTIDFEVMADPSLHKRESGHVRDAYRRGWFLRWLDLVQPF